MLFHQYQRYKNAELIINCVRKNKECFKILEVGSGIHHNLGKFCASDDIVYLEKYIPSGYKFNDIVCGDACDMEFSDGEFDIVVALDVYEHISPQQREHFLKEIFRVTKKIVILSAPFAHDWNVKSQANMIDFANTYFQDIPLWLNEHEEYGLPEINDFNISLKALGCDFCHFGHGNVDLSEKMLKAEMLAGISHDSCYYLQLMHHLYNEELFCTDYGDRAIREFFILIKDGALKADINDFVGKLVSRTEPHSFFYKDINMYSNMIMENFITPAIFKGCMELSVECGTSFNEEILLKRNVCDGNNFVRIKNISRDGVYRIKCFNDMYFLENFIIRGYTLEGNVEVKNVEYNDIIKEYNDGNLFLMNKDSMICVDVGCDCEYFTIEFSLFALKETEENYVDVLLMSYNQELYIKQAIESILAQKVNFNYRIIVCDDCSTDNTLKIINEYVCSYPKRFIALENSCNLGITKNYKRAFDNVSSKYVAILEGDDYWIDPYKLLYSYYFLEKNKDCSMCANRVKLLVESNGKIVDHANNVYGKHDRKLSGYDLALNNFIGNFSACFYRKKVLKELDDAIFEKKSYDWLINLCCAKNHQIGYLCTPMSVYRIHGNGTWSGQTPKQRFISMIDTINEYDELLGGTYHEAFEQHKRCLSTNYWKEYINFYGKCLGKKFVPSKLVDAIKGILQRS